MNTSNDSHETVFPADPRITAYAFGELEGDELRFIEAAVAADPVLQAAVAELRGFGGQLATALGEEKSGIEEAPAPVAAPKKRRGLLIPFRLHYLATAAAACFAVVVWMRQEPAVSPSEQTQTPASFVPPAAPAARLKSIAEPEVAREPVLSVAWKKDAPQELDHRVQVARKEAPAPASSSPVFDTHIAQEASASLPKPVMPELPKTAEASSLAGVGFGAGQSAGGASGMGSGMGYNTGLGSAGGSTTKQRSRASIEAKAGVSDGYAAVGLSPSPAAAQLVSFSNSDSYASRSDSAYRTAESEPLSTFSIDVDTASYANVRRFITSGRLPPRDAVRIEELINYFPYRYAAPKAGAKDAPPFAAKLEVASAPWAPTHRLVRVGLKARELTAATRPSANLVFLLDVSGSMRPSNKLPLVKESLRLLVERLRPDDRVAIVTYAGSSGLALPSTPASRKNEILAALENLNASGSTNGAMGIHLAYDIAKANFVPDGGINRVILCTDGDFNVGVTDRAELVRLVEEKARSRVFLSVFGFGMGNLKDNTLESLADKGNGAYGYIDTRREAEKVFVEQVEGTLATVAKDVKIQVEFNPARVASYRLIGYENRILAKEDFNNDAVDAGDIGAGHTVTALYEIVPAGADEDGSARPAVDALKYQKTAPAVRKPKPVNSSELLTVKIRYKAPEGDVSRKQEFPLIDTGADFAKADGEFQFAAAVAAWGMLLRDSPHKGTATFEQVLGWAENGLGDDDGGYRAEFIQLVRKSAELAK